MPTCYDGDEGDDGDDGDDEEEDDAFRSFVLIFTYVAALTTIM